MNRSLFAFFRPFTGGLLAVALGATAFPAPAAADGAASTRNILLGGAAAAAGTLIILNHNKKVHEKYADYDRRQAATAAQANQAQAAYRSEQAAYRHEAALVSEYKEETAAQHAIIQQQNRTIGSLQASLRVARAGGATAPGFMAPTPLGAARVQNPVQVASYGWGSF